MQSMRDCAILSRFQVRSNRLMSCETERASDKRVTSVTKGRHRQLSLHVYAR